MSWNVQSLSLTIAILFLLPLSTFAQSSEVTQIRIVSSWVGLGPSAHDELTIKRRAGGYYANDTNVTAQLISKLLDAANAPPVAKPDVVNLGITQTWLNANAEPGIKKYADFYYSTAAPNLRTLYLSSFKDMAFMQQLLPVSCFGGTPTLIRRAC